MKESEIKVLSFREELIKLCHKYKCNICGSYNDFNDDFCIEFDDGLNYTAKANGISVFTVDDFPTLDLPTNAISGIPSAGY